jgi:putative endonuclease
MGVLREYSVYIMTNQPRGTLYIGITNDLFRRVGEHRAGIGSAFVRKYRLTRLVYYEMFGDVNNAIYREKRLKKWYRAWKIALVEKDNPYWCDLYEDFLKL